MTILVIMLILGLVMFPIWPFSVKYGIWLVSLVLLVVLVGIIVLRLLVYIVFAIFNYHIWIFPDLFYSNGILDSFIPVLQVNKGDGTWFNVFVRLFALSTFCLLSLHIYLNPTFLEGTSLSMQKLFNRPK
jgi:translocation protein SEC62